MLVFFTPETTPDWYGQGLEQKLDKCPSLHRELTNECESQFTCEDKCGVGLKSRGGRSKSRVCACDVLCLVYGDCCDDVTDKCPSIVSRWQMSPLKRLSSSITGCVNGYAVVSSCPVDLETSGNSNDEYENFPHSRNYTEETFRNLTEEDRPYSKKAIIKTEQEIEAQQRLNYSVSLATDWKHQMAVTDTKDGVTYINMSVYLCNNVGIVNKNNLIVWAPVYISRRPIENKDVVDYFVHGNVSKKFTDKLKMTPPRKLSPRQCLSTDVSVLCRNLCGTLDVNFSRACASRSVRAVGSDLWENVFTYEDLNTTNRRSNSSESRLMFTQLGTTPSLSTCLLTFPSSRGFSDFYVLFDLEEKSLKFLNEQLTIDGWNFIRCSSTSVETGGCDLEFSCLKNQIYKEECIEVSQLMVDIRFELSEFRKNIKHEILTEIFQEIRVKKFSYLATCKDPGVKCFIKILFVAPNIVGNSSDFTDIFKNRLSNLNTGNLTVKVCYNTDPNLKHIPEKWASPSYSQFNFVKRSGSQMVLSMFKEICLLPQNGLKSVGTLPYIWYCL